MKRAAILLGPGGHNVQANRRLRDLAAAFQRREIEVPAVAAYVQAGKWGAKPALGEAIETFVATDVEEIAVVPVLVDWPYPELIDVPDLIADLAREYPTIRLHLARTLGAAGDLLEVLEHQLRAAWGLPDLATASVRAIAVIADQSPVTTAVPKEGVFPKLPGHEQHVFVCTGRRCQELGSADAYRRLNELLEEQGLDQGAHRVKVNRTKCLSPCASAPVACVYPSGMFFARLDQAAIPAFVEEVLVQGRPLAGHSYRPGE